MRLIDRIGALLRADAHGMVEALEDPALLIRQQLREAELELLQKRARVDALRDEEERLADEGARARERVSRLDDDVEMALREDQADLARFTVRKLLPERRDAETLELQREETRKAREKLEATLGEQEEALDRLRVRARARLARAPGDSLAAGGGTGVADEEDELELLRRRLEAAEPLGEGA